MFVKTIVFVFHRGAIVALIHVISNCNLEDQRMVSGLGYTEVCLSQVFLNDLVRVVTKVALALFFFITRTRRQTHLSARY